MMGHCLHEALKKHSLLWVVRQTKISANSQRNVHHWTHRNTVLNQAHVIHSMTFETFDCSCCAIICIVWLFATCRSPHHACKNTNQHYDTSYVPLLAVYLVSTGIILVTEDAFFSCSLVLCYIARWQPLRVRLVQGSHFTSWLLWLDRVNHWCPWNIDTALQFITLLDSNIQHVSCWKFGNLDVNWSSSCCVFWHNLIGLIRCQSSCLIAKNGLLKKQPSLNLIISWDLFW